MIPQEVISELKRKYKEIYSASIRNNEYIFRPLTFSEYDKLVESNDQLSGAEVEDEIVSAAVLWPKDFDSSRMPAGIFTQLAEEILEVSGFTSAEHARQVFAEKRQQAETVRYMMKAFVLAVMPTYRDTDLDDLTFTELAEKVALSEQIINVLQAIHAIPSENQVLLEITDPQTEHAEKAAAKARYERQRAPGQATYDDPIAAKLHAALR